MHSELYIEYAIRLLEAAKRAEIKRKKLARIRKKMKARLFEEEQKPGFLQRFFGRPDLEKIFGEGVDKVKEKISQLAEKVYGQDGANSVEQLINSMKDYMSKIHPDSQDAKAAQYMALKALAKGRKALEDFVKKCKNNQVQNAQDICNKAEAALNALPKFGTFERLWLFFKSQHPVVKVLLIIVGIVLLGLILYGVYKVGRKVVPMIINLIRKRKVKEVEEVLEEASTENVATAATVISSGVETVEAVADYYLYE